MTQVDARRFVRLANLTTFTHNSQSNVSGGFAMAVRSRKFQFGLMLATAFSVFVWPAVSRAYTPEQQQACSSDAMRLCSAFIPDVDRITGCMIQNKSQLSPECRVYFRPEPELAASPGAGRPLSIRPENSGRGARSRKSRDAD